MITKTLDLNLLGYPDVGNFFETRSEDLDSRFSYREQYQSEPLIKGSLGNAALQQNQVDYLAIWFHACKGQAIPWLLRVPGFNSLTAIAKDAGDGQLTQGQLLSINGSATQYQLYRVASGDASTVYKPIRFPVASTLQIYRNGSLMTSGYTLGSYGVVTFSSSQTGQALTVSGSYDTAVRFNSDTLNVLYLRDDRNNDTGDVTLDVTGQVWYQFDGLPIIEALPPF